MKCPFKRKSSRITADTDDANLAIDLVFEHFEDCDQEDCMAWRNGQCELMKQQKSGGGH